MERAWRIIFPRKFLFNNVIVALFDSENVRQEGCRRKVIT
jgi:hypothetical protein